MNFPNNLKSSRTSMVGISMNNQLGDLTNLQQCLLQKDQLISTLQGTINKLQLKNKQYSTYQQAMLEYEAQAQQASNEILKINQKLRAKIAQCEQLKKKLDQQLKQKKQRATSYVKHEDYARLSNEYKKFKQTHRACENAIKQQKKKAQQVHNDVIALKQEINSLLDVINLKNVQINDLKVEKYNLKSNDSIQSLKDLNARSGTNIISSFKVIGEENPNSIKEGGQVQKINFYLVAYSRQNDELRKRCHKLQKQLQNYMNPNVQWSAQKTNKQYSQIIDQYEANLASMSLKITAIHKLEMQKNINQQQKRKLQVQCEELRQQLTSRISYCDILQKKIRQIDHYKGVSMQDDIFNFVTRNQKLQRQVEILQKILKEKHEQIIQLKKKYESLEITQQTYLLIQKNLNSLEQNLSSTKNQLRKEQQKNIQKQQQIFKIQRQTKRLQLQMAEVKSQMAKTNRIVSQKVQKIQFQSIQIKRLEKQIGEKKQISEKLAKSQNQYKKLDKMYQEQLDQSNQLAMSVIVLSAQVQRLIMNGSMNKKFILEFEDLKQKSRLAQINSKQLEQRVKRLQHLHKKVVQQLIKISENLHASHKRWNHYDTAMQRLIKFLQTSEQSNNQKYQQLDSNINTWLLLQDQRLKQLAKTDKLGQQTQYIKYTSKITTQPLILQPAPKNQSNQS